MLSTVKSFCWECFNKQTFLSWSLLPPILFNYLIDRMWRTPYSCTYLPIQQSQFNYLFMFRKLYLKMLIYLIRAGNIYVYFFRNNNGFRFEGQLVYSFVSNLVMEIGKENVALCSNLFLCFLQWLFLYKHLFVSLLLFLNRLIILVNWW